MAKKDETIFIEVLICTFPEIKDEVLDEDWVDITSLQIACFTRFTQKAIDANDNDIVLRCFQFVDSNIDNVIFKVENSLTISWLGKLNFDKNKKAYGFLPPQLKELYTTLLQV